MVRLTLRNIVAHKARFVMTTFAVVLGVSFVVASFVLSDGLRSTFDDLSEEITGGTDLVVRPTSDFGEPLPLDGALVGEIAVLDGVDQAVAFVEADGERFFVRPVPGWFRVGEHCTFEIDPGDVPVPGRARHAYDVRPARPGE